MFEITDKSGKILAECPTWLAASRVQDALQRYTHRPAFIRSKNVEQARIDAKTLVSEAKRLAKRTGKMVSVSALARAYEAGEFVWDGDVLVPASK